MIVTPEKANIVAKYGLGVAYPTKRRVIKLSLDFSFPLLDLCVNLNYLATCESEQEVLFFFLGF